MIITKLVMVRVQILYNKQEKLNNNLFEVSKGSKFESGLAQKAQIPTMRGRGGPSSLCAILFLQALCPKT
jgi:hypothetical protein